MMDASCNLGRHFRQIMSTLSNFQSRPSPTLQNTTAVGCIKNTTASRLSKYNHRVKLHIDYYFQIDRSISDERRLRLRLAEALRPSRPCPRPYSWSRQWPEMMDFANPSKVDIRMLNRILCEADVSI